MLSPEKEESNLCNQKIHSLNACFIVFKLLRIWKHEGYLENVFLSKPWLNVFNVLLPTLKCDTMQALWGRSMHAVRSLREISLCGFFLGVWCCVWVFLSWIALEEIAFTFLSCLPYPLLGVVTTATISTLTSSAELVQTWVCTHHYSTSYCLEISGIRIFSYFWLISGYVRL